MQKERKKRGIRFLARQEESVEKFGPETTTFSKLRENRRSREEETLQVEDILGGERQPIVKSEKRKGR